MKSRIRRISNSVDITFGGSSSSAAAPAASSSSTPSTTASTSTPAAATTTTTTTTTPPSTSASPSTTVAPTPAPSSFSSSSSSIISSSAQSSIKKTQSTDFHPTHHHQHSHSNYHHPGATLSLSGKHSSQDSALGSTANNSIEQYPTFFTTNYNNSRSLDIQSVTESRLDKMRKLLSSPLLRKRNASSCHHGHHSHHSVHHTSAHSVGQNPASSQSASGSGQITRDANSSPSSSPSSSPALASSASLRTFGVSLESLSNHQHPHHRQSTYEGECPSFYYRDPELVIVPHQKAAHILGQVCAGCLTSVPSNSSSMGSIHESTSSGAVHSHTLDDPQQSGAGPAPTSSPGTSSSSTTSSTSSVHCGPQSSHYLIPFIVTRLCNYIENDHGLTHEGLFRVSGNAKLVDRLKKSFDETGDAPLEAEADLGSATTLLKQFLRELPHPLIPNGPQFLDVLRSLKSDHDTCVLALKSLISQLPDENYFTLRYLMRFLHRIDLRNEENRMSATNLGIVFAPNLFRVCVDTYQGLKDQSTANEVVHLLITEFKEIFGDVNTKTIHPSVYSRDNISVEDLSECPFAHDDDERGKLYSGDETDNNDEAACTRSLIDFRAEDLESNDLDRKRKDYQTGCYSARTNVDDYYDTGEGSHLQHQQQQQQRSQSVELGMDQLSNKAKPEADVERTSSVRSTTSGPSSDSSSACSGSGCGHADIIVTNSSDSVSTDDNTATTATSTGATVCSVMIAGLPQKGRCLEPGVAHLRHFSSSGDEGPDRSLGSLPVRTARSGSCSSDSTENQNLRISLSDDEDGSLSRSIASACLTDDGEESDDTSSSILDGDTSGNEAGSSSSVNDNEADAGGTGTGGQQSKPEDESVLRPILPDMEQETEKLSRSNSVKSRTSRRFASIRRKLKQFESDFRQENGFEPTYENKMTSSFARPLMLELSSILNMSTPSLRDIDIDAADPSKTDHYREASPTRSTFNARQQPNKRFPINWRGPGTSTSGTGSTIPLSGDHYLPTPAGGLSQVTEQPSQPNSASASLMSKDDIFNAIFGKKSEKQLDHLKQIMAEIEDNLIYSRMLSARPDDLGLMRPDEIIDEKFALQKALLRFEAMYGRPVTKDERDIVRPVYDRYRIVKRMAQNAKNAMKSTSNAISIFSASDTATIVAASELAPIIENVQMDFKSPTSGNKGPTLLEFDAESKKCPSTLKLSANYHEMNHQELEKEYACVKQQRRNVRMVLRTFESDFLQRTGRRVEREDRCNMSAAYSAYRNAKAKLRLIQALLKKCRSESKTNLTEPTSDE